MFETTTIAPMLECAATIAHCLATISLFLCVRRNRASIRNLTNAYLAHNRALFKHKDAVNAVWTIVSPSAPSPFEDEKAEDEPAPARK